MRGGMPARRFGVRGCAMSNPGSINSGAMLQPSREFEERDGTIELGRGSKDDRVRTGVLGRILPFSISEIEEGCSGVSCSWPRRKESNRARNYLSSLREGIQD